MTTDANIIKIKRSGTSGAPSSLKLGELAYSYLSATGNPTNNGGDRLFIGANGVNGSTGNANDIIVIGGKYFTDLLDHTRGTLTASSAIVTDSNSVVDRLLTTGLNIGGTSGAGLDYTISTDNNNNLVLSTGTGNLSINGAYTLPNADGMAGYVLTTNGSGTVTWQASASSLSLKAGTGTGDTGTDATVNLLTDTFKIEGDSSAITTALTVSGTTNKAYTLEVAARLASTSQTGVASFDSTYFTVNGYGAVTITSGSIGNDRLTNSTISGVSLGGTLAALSNGNNIQSFTYDGSSTQSITLATDLTSVNSISSSSGTGNVTLNADGGHSYVFKDDGTVTFNNAYTFPSTHAGGSGYVLTDDGSGNLSWAAAAASFTVTGSSGSETLNLLTDTFSTVGSDSNISVAVTKDGTTVTSTITLASSLTGVSIDGNAGTVTNGVYTTGSYANPTWITNIDYSILNGTVPTWNQDTTGQAGKVANALSNGANIQMFTFDGSSTASVALATTLTDLTEVDVGNLIIASNDISAITGSGDQDVVIKSTASDGSTTHSWTFGSTGDLEVAGKITNVTDPTNPQDAATKAYVDATASGLKIHDPVTVATTAALSTIGGTVAYVDGPGTNGAPASVGATLTFTTPITALDGYTFTGSGSERILVKDQVSKKQNGVYVYTSSTVWTRSADFDIAANITGADFMFVEDGLTNGSTGWVQTDQTITSIGASGSDISFVQFSAANSYLAGDGINITGNSISVKLATNSGLSVSGGSLTISGIAGTATTTGLTYSNGVLQIGADGTSIDINGTSGNLEIKSTWAGQTAITTVGTITTGTWHGNVVSEIYGGTNQSSYAKGDILYASDTNTLSKLIAGSNGQMLQLQGGIPVWADLDGGTY